MSPKKKPTIKKTQTKGETHASPRTTVSRTNGVRSSKHSIARNQQADGGTETGTEVGSREDQRIPIQHDVGSRTISDQGRTVPNNSLASRLKTVPQTLAPHLIIEARAGTGKTTTLIEGLKLLKGLPTSIQPSPQQDAIWSQLLLSKDAQSICFVAFNKSIATELQQRVSAGVDAMTMHSMGLKAVTAAFGRVDINSYRVSDIISELLQRDIRELRKQSPTLIKATEDLVGLCKMNLLNGSEQELDSICSTYDIDINGSRSQIYDLVPQVIERCRDVKRDNKIDFNDMIWLPVVLNLSVTRYDLLLIDEFQDTSKCQQALAKKVGKRLILVGDPKQAIYGFAGADSQSMNRMELDLNIGCPRDEFGVVTNEHKCVKLPLTVTRRCGKSIVKEANKLVADFSAHESNCVGLVSQSTVTTYADKVQDDDMIVCRCNAPLISQCFKFLKAGRKATIQGRDVGTGLISTINKLKAVDVPELLFKLSDWLHSEQQKENAKRNPSESRLIMLQDRYDCLVCFTDNSKTVDEVKAKIESVFTDDRNGKGILLSSGHKSKGLERKRVFILQLKGASCPHPMAKTPMAKEQESNLLYVMITRTIEELTYVYDSEEN